MANVTLPFFKVKLPQSHLDHRGVGDSCFTIFTPPLVPIFIAQQIYSLHIDYILAILNMYYSFSAEFDHLDPALQQEEETYDFMDQGFILPESSTSNISYPLASPVGQVFGPSPEYDTLSSVYPPGEISGPFISPESGNSMSPWNDGDTALFDMVVPNTADIGICPLDVHRPPGAESVCQVNSIQVATGAHGGIGYGDTHLLPYDAGVNDGSIVVNGSSMETRHEHTTPSPQALIYPDLEDEEDIGDSDKNDGDYKPGRSRKSSRSGRAKPYSLPMPTKLRSVNSPKSARSKKGVLACSDCDYTCMESTSLLLHMRDEHSKPFHCLYHFGGCLQCFSAKNEWKRHLKTIHVVDRYWHCSLCNDTKLRGFRRKDLFKQHYLRAHHRHAAPLPRGRNGLLPHEQAELKAVEDQAETKKRDLPNSMSCSSVGCAHKCNGKSAWNDYLEHVADHMRSAELIQVGNRDDDSLIVMSQDLGIIERTKNGWKLL